jgi:hypothetical protein
MIKQIAVAFVALAISAAQTQAQSANRKVTYVPQTEGAMLGATTVVATGITINGPGVQRPINTNMGQGGGVTVGYGFSPRFLAFARADVVKQGANVANINGSFGLVNLEVGGRMTFQQAGKRAVPYVTAQVGSQALSARSDGGGISVTMRISGTHIGAGGGFLYALSPDIALDAGVSAARGKFSKIVLTGGANSSGTLNVDNSTNLRLRVGMAWHP